MPGPKNEPRQIQKIEDTVDFQNRNPIETERNLIADDDVKA
jgi:hypothetical protein